MEVATKKKPFSLLRKKSRICCVTGCNSGDYQLSKWEEDVCLVHQEFHSNCACSPPFFLFTFPTKKANSEQREKWVRMINRPGKNIDEPWLPGVKARVCSKHFVDSEPTVLNPLPTLNLGYNNSQRVQEGMMTRQKSSEQSCSMALDRSNPSPDGDENDILDEEFLAKAFGGTFQAISDEASDDGIDDIDINFDEGDGEALIHQEMKPFHSEGADTPTDCQILPEEAAEDVLSDDENFGLRDIKIEVIQPSDFITQTSSTTVLNSDRTCSSGTTLNFASDKIRQDLETARTNKADRIRKDLAEVGKCSRHNKMCKCEDCQLLIDTYNEFMQKKSENGSQPGEESPGPSSAKILKTEVKPHNIPQINTLVELTKFCQKCGIGFENHTNYRNHVKEKHPIYWKHVELESDFEEKRKLVVRNTDKFHKKKMLPKGNFFRRELERSKQQTVTLSHPTSTQATTSSQPVKPVETQQEKAPMTYFYPMMYPVYFVMDKNQQPGASPTMVGMQHGATPTMVGMQHGATPTMVGMQHGATPTMVGMQHGATPTMVSMQHGTTPTMVSMQPGATPTMVGMPPGAIPTMTSLKPGIPIPQMPQIGSMPPPGPVMIPPQMTMAAVEQNKEKVLCGECGLMFKYKEELILHMKVHSKRPYRCETCNLTFNTNVDLKRHYRCHAAYHCTQCNEFFSTRDKLVAHEAVRHSDYSEKVLTCSTCQLSFSNNVELKRHYRTHAFYKCKSCRESFVSWEQLVQHNKTAHIAGINELSANVKNCKACKEKRCTKHGLECKICGLQFENLDLLKVHRKQHLTENGDYGCTMCGKNFDTKDEMDRHIKDHEIKGEMLACTCYYCNLSFTNVDALSKHLKVHTNKALESEPTANHTNTEVIPTEEIIIKAEPIIKEEPVDYENFDMMLVEDEQNPTKNKHFACNKCGALFSRMFSLNRHYKIHTGERGYKCDDCGASFRTQSQQKTHSLTHTGERPFKCHMCPATFIQQGNLKRHIWTHTGTKPHVCGVCNSGFLSTSDLKRHFRTHTGEKPYKCQICNCSFTTSGNLKSHLKTHPSIH